MRFPFRKVINKSSQLEAASVDANGASGSKNGILEKVRMDNDRNMSTSTAPSLFDVESDTTS